MKFAIKLNENIKVALTIYIIGLTLFVFCTFNIYKTLFIDYYFESTHKKYKQIEYKHNVSKHLPNWKYDKNTASFSEAFIFEPRTKNDENNIKIGLILLCLILIVSIFLLKASYNRFKAEFKINTLSKKINLFSKMLIGLILVLFTTIVMDLYSIIIQSDLELKRSLEIIEELKAPKVP